jgi:hypothetical protein
MYGIFLLSLKFIYTCAVKYQSIVLKIIFGFCDQRICDFFFGQLWKVNFVMVFFFFLLFLFLTLSFIVCWQGEGSGKPVERIM